MDPSWVAKLRITVNSRLFESAAPLPTGCSDGADAGDEEDESETGHPEWNAHVERMTLADVFLDAFKVLRKT